MPKNLERSAIMGRDDAPIVIDVSSGNYEF